MSTTKLSETLELSKYKQLGYKNNILKPVKLNTTDTLIVECADLINPVFHDWYRKKANQIGRDRFLAIASESRCDGRNPKRLFSYKLKLAGV